MPASATKAAHPGLQRRLLNDIADIQQDPYPNVYLYINDANIRVACLVLTPEDSDPLHLTVKFENDYPLRAPQVTIQSRIEHPNVFGQYICATMLNTTEGWTPAYTLQGIVIQLLSFFCSDSIEQDYGNDTVDLAAFRRQNAEWRKRNGQKQLTSDTFSCSTCAFGPHWAPHSDENVHLDDNKSAVTRPISVSYNTPNKKRSNLFQLPDEVILQLLVYLDTRDVLAFADAVPTIKSMVFSYDFIRTRELQCYCLKQSFMETKLGIGVQIAGGRKPVFRSEFDLLSQEAFFQHSVRRSIQGVSFDKWLPLPLSRRHWRKVETNVTACLEAIHKQANMDTKSGTSYIDVLYHFMTNIVVQFSSDCEKGYNHADQRSTLNHASEKAVEAYFALFHLLLCLATQFKSIIRAAQRIIDRFISGPRSKSYFPDLGHVLVAALISDTGLTEELTFLVIKEAILRNVVWALDAQGAGYAELAYLEPTSVSDYRLAMTFHASRTSYRLLMFLKLFSSAARPPQKTLEELRDDLFDTHGAPPPGTCTEMAHRTRQIHDIDSFPKFLKAMGIKDLPSKSEFTAFLRRTITDSVKAGYSCSPMTQTQLYMIRKVREKGVEKADGVVVTPQLVQWFDAGEKWYNNGWKGRPSFFPARSSRPGYDGANGPGGRGGRGRGRGLGRGGRG